MKLKVAMLGLATLLLSVLLVAPLSAEAAHKTGSGAPADLGTYTLADGSSVHALFTVTHFVNNNGVLQAVGTVTATKTALDGTVTTASQPATVAVQSINGHALPTSAPTLSSTNAPAAANGGCAILDLTLGPLHLNLLGLVVDLNQIHLQITAQPGAGNLLGNLLCAVSNLLNNGAPLSNLLNGLTNLLNNILSQL